VIMMKVLHLNAGAETGGGMVHILDLLHNFKDTEIILGLFEKGLMYDKALEKGIKAVVFNQKSKWDIKIIKKVLKLVDGEKIDIIHTHGPRANFFGCFIKRKRQNLKWITTVHSNPHHDFLGKGVVGDIFTTIHLWALKKPDHCLAISKQFKSMLITDGIEEKKITTIYNGLDFKRPSEENTLSRGEFNIDPNDFLMIMVARLCPVKGHSIVFTVIKELAKVKLLVVGSGFLEEELKQQVVKLGIEEKVLFLGHRHDVDALFHISDLKLLASLSESFPLVLLEAARAKKPVITSDVGGVRDLIPSNEYGWIVPVDEKGALKKAIEEAIEYRELGMLKEIGINLYNRASTYFTLDNFRESVLNTYKNLV
jgi:L-malate glycosyltransferase